MRTRLLLLLLLLGLSGCNRISIPLEAPPPQQVTVTIIADGETRSLTTSASTVADALEEAQVNLSILDLVEPGEYLLVEEGMVIQVTRVIETYETEELEIPFQRQIVRNEALSEGEQYLLQQGAPGIEELVYRIEYRDSVESERRIVRRQVVKAAEDEIVMIGVKGTISPVSIPGTLAYISGGNGVVMRTSSSNRDTIVSSGDLDGRVFSLSPDGRQLLYSRSIASSSVATDTLPAFNSLWVIGTTRFGSQTRPQALEVENVLWANWSPDGEQIAYSTAVPISQPPGWEANNDLWLGEWDADGDFITEEFLEPSGGGVYGWWGAQYAWSPNGRYLAYGQADQVGLIDLQTGEREILKEYEVYNTYSDWVWTPTLTWSPDNRFVAAVAHALSSGLEDPEDSPVFEVWAWDIDGQAAASLVTRVGMWGMPAWSPSFQMGLENASQIAFLQASKPLDSANTLYALWLVDRDGSNPRRVFPAEGEIGLQPQPVAWSPEGDQIALIYGGNLYLVAANLDENWNRPLTGDGINSNPVWAPWGDAIDSNVPAPDLDDIPFE